MKVTVTTLNDEMFTLEVSEDMELENFKALCEFECGVPSAEISISLNGRPLQDDKKTLKEYGTGDGEVLLLQRLRPQSSAPSQPGKCETFSFAFEGQNRFFWTFLTHS